MAKRKRRRPSAATDRVAAARVARPRLRTDRVALAIAAAGLLLTGYLTALAGSEAAPALCTEGSGCAAIQSSAWSTLLGLPLALWGFVLYALVALAAVTGRSPLVRWRWLSRLSLLGLAISLLLAVVGWIDAGASCAWCLLSLGLLATLFAWVHARRPAGAPGRAGWTSWWLGNGLVATAAMALLVISGTGVLDRRPEDPRVAGLVDHLDALGATYYGASWCANCRRQTRLFGASANRLRYVECTPEGRGGPVAGACVRAGINAYPTWVVHGLQHPGLKTPEELAQLSGYVWESRGD